MPSSLTQEEKERSVFRGFRNVESVISKNISVIVKQKVDKAILDASMSMKAKQKVNADVLDASAHSVRFE